MANKQNTNQNKTAIYIELFPYEKEAFEEWVMGKFHSVSDAIRSHIRKVTGLDPESQEQNEKSPTTQPTKLDGGLRRGVNRDV